MSIIIISAVLLMLVVTLNAASFFNRFNVLESENKRISLGLAEACVNSALLKMANSDYTAQSDVVVDSSNSAYKCNICVITSGGSIKTRAVYNNAYTNISVTVDPNTTPYSITNWSEDATYSGSCPL
jgi:hypothetical protein